MSKKLEPKQARFVQEYLKDLNATQAARRAGYSPRTAKQQGARLLTKADVQVAVCAGQAQRAARLEVTQDNVLRELARIGFSDIRSVFDENGRLRLVSELPNDVAAAIASVEVSREKTTRLGAGRKRITVEEALVKVKTWDKTRALEMLAKHLGMFKEVGDKERPLHAITRVTFGGRYRPEATT